MNKVEEAIKKYDELTTLFLSNNFSTSNYKEINFGLQFLVKKSDWSGIVRIYQNNKGGVKVDLSQLDDSEHSTLIKGFFQIQNSSIYAKDSALISLDDLSFPIMGSDESGKGDYFGSLVVACVCIDEKDIIELSSFGVRDSKTLSDTKIMQVAKVIRKYCHDRFVVVEISPEKYNQLYTKLESQSKSLNDLLAWAHAKAIEELLLKVECQTVIVDRFANENVLIENLQEKGKKLNVIQTVRAERHVAVAAASILARDRFITKLDKLGNKYQIILPKGASTAVIETAKQLVRKDGTDILRKVAKLHFKTTQEV
jgi:ribonuclease HIII